MIGVSNHKPGNCCPDVKNIAENSTMLLIIDFWERFGFYGVTSVLIIFMTSQLGYSDKHGYMLFASYMALMHLTPIIGGYLARVALGYVASFVLGLILLVAGCVPIAGHFYMSLALIIVGQGFFKSIPFSLPEMVYKSASTKRHALGSSFVGYIIVNILCIAPLLLSGCFAMNNYWTCSFICAGFSMVLGTFSFFLFYHQMREYDQNLNLNILSVRNIIMITLCVLFSLFVFRYLLMSPVIVIYGVFLYAAAIIFKIYQKCLFMFKKDVYKVVVLSLMMFSGSVFFALNYQQAASLTVFINRYVSCYFFGCLVPCEVYWVLNPLWIIVLSALFCTVRKFFCINSNKFSPSLRLVLGGASITIGYLILSFACFIDKSGAHVSAWWIVCGYMFQSLSEICIFNCLVFSDFSRLVPDDIKKILVPLWFVAYAIGCVLIGIFADQASVPFRIFGDAAGYIHIYSHAFMIFSIISSLVCLLLLVLAKPFYRLTNSMQ